jgi:addiction module HigA family antidote
MSIPMADVLAGRVDLSDIVDPSVPRLPPLTPGEMLREEFMVPLGLSARRLAAEIGVPTNRITGILHATRAISAETAILLGRRFKMSPQFWLGLQMDYDLERAQAAMEAAEKARQPAKPRRRQRIATRKTTSPSAPADKTRRRSGAAR